VKPRRRVVGVAGNVNVSVGRNRVNEATWLGGLQAGDLGANKAKQTGI
jgi:hypothetical protein